MNLPTFPDIDLSCAGINALNRILVASVVKDPTYLLVCLATGLLGLAVYRYADSKAGRFRTAALTFSRRSRWSIRADRRPDDSHEHEQHVH